MTDELTAPTPPVPEPAPTPEADPRFAVAPQDRRFLFVDIAALRAKQLRRGALNRLRPPQAEATPDGVPASPHKAERIAMEEVRRGFIQYELPSPAAPTKPESETEA